MKEIHTAIPDVDALLALQPEELAGKLLFLMKERFRIKPDQLQPSDFIAEVMTEPTEPEGGIGNVPMNDPVEAIEIAMLASHLLKIVDARKTMKLGREQNPGA